MKQAIVHIALVVRDYDEAIEFYTNKLHFTLVEDTYQPQQDKRWVVVSPPDDFKRDYRDMKKNGIHFVREPKEADYGTVAVFEDLYGNLWDLVQFQEGHPMCKRL